MRAMTGLISCRKLMTSSIRIRVAAKQHFKNVAKHEIFDGNIWKSAKFRKNTIDFCVIFDIDPINVHDQDW